MPNKDKKNLDFHKIKTIWSDKKKKERVKKKKKEKRVKKERKREETSLFSFTIV